MSQLHFAGLTQDGRTMLVLDERGEQHQLTVDERVKAAARGDAARLGQLELTIEPTLRPAEIQARVRAGESPEDVARTASMPVEKVLRFAGTVMAERAMYAERARAHRLRCEGPYDGKPLGETVGALLAEQGVDAAAARWDAARRSDGQWCVAARWGTGKKARPGSGRAGEAVFRYDAAAKHATPDDDGARSLLAPPVPDVETPIVEDMAPFADDVAPKLEGPAIAPPVEERAARPFSLIRSAAPTRPADPIPAPTAEHRPAQVEQRAASGDGTTPRGRHPKIPAWDDIVFGARKNG